MADAVDRLRAFWDERYRGDGYAYGTTPNDFLVGAVEGMALSGRRVLCLADGEGRNGVWLATRGASVTSVDISAEGLAKARRLADAAGVRIETLVADVGALTIEPARWDLIVSIFLHLPAPLRAELHRRCLNGLAPGGRFVFEAYAPGQQARGTGGPKEPSLLVDLSTLKAETPLPTVCTAARGWQGERVVREGALHDGAAEVTQWIIQRQG